MKKFFIGAMAISFLIILWRGDVRRTSFVPWVVFEEHTFGFHFSCPADTRIDTFKNAFGCVQKENGWGLGGVRVIPTDAKTATEWIAEQNTKGDPNGQIVVLAERDIGGFEAVTTYRINEHEVPIIDPSRWEKTTYVVRNGDLFSIASRFGSAMDTRFLSSFGFLEISELN